MQEYWLIGGIIATVIVFAAVKPLRRLLKVSLKILLGPAALAAVNFAGGLIGVGLGINIWTVIVSVVLGLPGVCSLLVLRILLQA